MFGYQYRVLNAHERDKMTLGEHHVNKENQGNKGKRQWPQ